MKNQKSFELRLRLSVYTIHTKGRMIGYENTDCGG